MSVHHFNIPIFIPEKACPFRCVFCDQHKITDQKQMPTDEEITSIIEKRLKTIPDDHHSVIEIAFFGGNFTGIPLIEQEHLLQLVQPWLDGGRVRGIRISTRPDYINKEVLQLLKQYRVKVIELGAQSFDDEVLIKAGRGHTAADTEEAAQMIRREGFSLGLQMMTGLPGDSFASIMKTAKRIVALGAGNTRIYPVLVIEGTQLAEMYKAGTFNPPDIAQTIQFLRWLLPYFSESKVDVIRVGLHPSESLLCGDGLLAGPFHPALKQMALSAVWQDAFWNYQFDTRHDAIDVFVPKGQRANAIGYQAKNKTALLKNFKEVKFYIDPFLRGYNFYVNYR